MDTTAALMNAAAALRTAITSCTAATAQWHADLDAAQDPSPPNTRKVYWLSASNGTPDALFARPDVPDTAHARIQRHIIAQRQRPVLDALHAATTNLSSALANLPVLAAHRMPPPVVVVRAVWEAPDTPRPIHFLIHPTHSPDRAKTTGAWRRHLRRYQPDIVAGLLENLTALRPDQAAPARAQSGLPLWDIVQDTHIWRVRADSPEHARIFAAGTLDSSIGWPDAHDLDITRSLCQDGPMRLPHRRG